MGLRFIEKEWDGLTRDRLIEAMSAEGVPISSGYGFPLYREPALMKRENLPPGNYPDYGSLNLPHAEKAGREGLLIPQTMLLAEPEEAMDIVRALEKIYEHRKELV